MNDAYRTVAPGPRGRNVGRPPRGRQKLSGLRGPAYDGAPDGRTAAYIRKAAIRYKIPYITTTAAAIAAAEGVAACLPNGKGQVRSLQEMEREYREAVCLPPALVKAKSWRLTARCWTRSSCRPASTPARRATASRASPWSPRAAMT